MYHETVLTSPNNCNAQAHDWLTMLPMLTIQDMCKIYSKYNTSTSRAVVYFMATGL